MSPANASERGATRRPFPLRTALLGVSIVAVAFSCLQILLYAHGRDQGIYAVVAETMLEGGMPYRDAWDFKPPGIFLIYAATHLLLGTAEWTIRAVEVASLVSMVFAFTRLTKRFFGDPRIGLVGGALAALVYAQLEFWHTAQPESFGAAAIAWAMVLATCAPASSGKARRSAILGWVAAGALYGFAGLLKPPLAGCAVVSASFASWNIARKGGTTLSRLAPIVVMGLSGALVIAFCALWFFANGAFQHLYETLFVFAPGYTKLSWQGMSLPGALYLAAERWLTSYSAANAVGILAAMMLPPLAAREREGIVHILGVVGMQLVGIAMQGKFFPYHFGACLPLGGLLAGLGAWKLWEHASRRPTWGVPIFVTCSLFLFDARTATRDTATGFLDRSMKRLSWLLSPPYDKPSLDAELYSVADVSNEQNHAAATFLRAKLAPEERVFIWGFEPHIYLLSNRRPASRYIYNVPQRVDWARDTTRTALLQDLDTSPPAAILVERRDIFPMVTGDYLDSESSLATFPELVRLLEADYELVATLDDFDIYLRISRSTRDASAGHQ